MGGKNNYDRILKAMMRAAKFVFALALLFLTACSIPQPSAFGRLNVVATIPMLGDVVHVIGGDMINLTVLIPPGTDPHSFEPVPQDATRVAQADVIFINGLELEGFLRSLLNDATGHGQMVTASDGIATIKFEGEEYGADPHVWMNPLNVKVWVDNIAEALAQNDPTNADAYHANAEAYKTQLDELDQWAVNQISQIPAAQRQLVTDHDSFGYFADHYGFQVVGALIPSYSTQSEPSAGELADLETAIKQYGPKAIFVGVSLNPALAQRVAADTSVNLVPIYTESLSATDGPAATYLDMIHFDVEAIVEALK